MYPSRITNFLIAFDGVFSETKQGDKGVMHIFLD
jgi:hypothetical protein